MAFARAELGAVSEFAGILGYDSITIHPIFDPDCHARRDIGRRVRYVVRRARRYYLGEQRGQVCRGMFSYRDSSPPRLAR